MTELNSDDPNTPISVRVDSSGSVLISQELTTALTTDRIRVEGYELRSPVRANDQYVLFDRRGLNSRVDVDGDGRADELDMAGYRVVVSNEPVSLPEATTPLTALRVDTVLLVRVRPSGGGAVRLFSQRDSSWYAPGIGIVRNVLHSDSAPGAYEVESLLTGFDGVTRGWGAIVRESQWADSNAGPTGRVYAAAAVPDGIVAITGFHVLKIDRNGRIVSGQSIAQAGISGSGGLYSTASGLRYVESSNQNDIRVFRLNDQGSLQGTGPVGRIDLQALNAPGAFLRITSLAIAPGGTRLWLSWQRSALDTSGNYRDALLAREFDVDGAPAGGEIELAGGIGLGSTVLARPSASNGLILSWSEYAPSQAMVQAKLRADGSVAWRSRQSSNSVLAPCCVAPLDDTTGTWLTWRSERASVSVLHGVRVDDSGRFVGVPTDDSVYASQELPIDAEFSPAWPYATTFREGRFHAAAKVWSAPHANDPRVYNHLEYAEFNAGPGALAAGMTRTRRVVLDGLVEPSMVAPFVFDDRVLLLTDDGQTLRPAVIWRN
ncbi:MAG: hypothetical protein H7Z15_21850 [Rhizobacter sp.]|nr:hypothetical protein [Rhizobacter sp.]